MFKYSRLQVNAIFISNIGSHSIVFLGKEFKHGLSHITHVTIRAIVKNRILKDQLDVYCKVPHVLEDPNFPNLS